MPRELPANRQPLDIRGLGAKRTCGGGRQGPGEQAQTERAPKGRGSKPRPSVRPCGRRCIVRPRSKVAGVTTPKYVTPAGRSCRKNGELLLRYEQPRNWKVARSTS